MKKIEFFLIIIIVGVSIFSFHQIYQDSKKIEFLENALAVKNLEYEWLSEITNELVYSNSLELKEEIKEFIKFREQQPLT